jgi:hypothetical protein
MQPLDLWAEKMPITYYAETGPAGDVMKLVTSGRMAVIGLGAGQMACYTTKDRPIDYYELDPDVLKLAEAHFTYLAKCPPQAMHIGDARLSLMQDGPKYRVIVLDAFSSDSIPTHLLTREAIQVYLNRLEPGGYLLFHISNNFFALDGPLAETAKSLGLWSLYKYGPELLTNDYDLASNWLIMGGDRQVETALRAQGWHEADSYPNPWTDDYAPVMSVIRFLKPPNR